VYVVSSMILKGGLMIMYGYFMYKMFSGDRDFDMSDSEPDLDYDEVPF
jgi:predicted nucleotidyltransferase component of viral defense system